MNELATNLGLEDLHDILEIVMVETHNKRVADEIKRRNEER